MNGIKLGASTLIAVFVITVAFFLLTLAYGAYLDI